MERNSCTPDLLKEGGDEFSDISLRPLDLSDIDDFMVWATDAEVARFCSWEPYSNKEDALNYIKNSVLPHPWFRAICLNNRPIGAVSVQMLRAYVRALDASSPDEVDKKQVASK